MNPKPRGRYRGPMPSVKQQWDKWSANDPAMKELEKKMLEGAAKIITEIFLYAFRRAWSDGFVQECHGQPMFTVKDDDPHITWDADGMERVGK